MSARASFTVALAALVAGCSGLLVAGCGGATLTAGTQPGVAQPAAPRQLAQDFSLPTLDGGTVRLSEQRGKVVLVDFWATTCDPCLAAMPHLVDLYKKHKDAGFVILGVSLDGPETRAEVRSVVHDRGMVFPILLDEETSVVVRYNPKRELPFSMLIGRDGSILSKRSGYTPGEEENLAREVEQALRQ